MAPINGHLETFCLESLLNLENIQQCAHAFNNDKHILALVTSVGDVVLYYISEDCYVTLRRIPWFVEPDRKISALSFHPHGAWLLATSWDGSLHMVPAMALVDPGSQGDTRWNTLDLTTFPNVTTSTPSCLVWWQSNIEGSQIAIVGTVTGEIVMYNLISRERIGAVSISGPVDSLRLCHDSAITVMLLITNKARQQWKLLLESREAGFVWPLENRTGSKGDNSDPSSALSPTPPVRSRLQGLKQMSVEKIASIRQRLAERTRSITPQSPLTASQNNQNAVGGSKGSEGEVPLPASSQNPEKWSTELFLCPQQCRSYHVLSGLHSPTCTLTLNSIVNMELVPVTTYRVPTGSSEVLVTNNFMFVIDASGTTLFVLSCKTAEARLDSLSEAVGPEALEEVDKLELKPGESFLAFYLFPGPYEGENSSLQNFHRKSVNFGRRIPKPRNNTLRGVLHPSVEEELKTVKGFNVPSCIVITSQNVYLLLLSEAISRRVLDYLIRGCKIDLAEHLCSVFGLDMQKLLELAGDEQFNRGQYAAGGKLHQLAKSRKLKILLKFSSKGKASFLLTLISELLTSSFRHQDLSVVERVHLVKMLMLCYIKELLDAKRDDPITEKNFVKLLRDFRIYDQSLCTSLIGQVGFFKALHILCEYRSLAPECLESLTLTMEQIMNKSHKKGTLVRSCLLVTLPDFWDIASDFSLQEGIIQRPSLARTHFKFILENLDSLSPNILKRLVALYDPTTPTFHPTARITLNDVKLGLSRKYSDVSAFSLYRRSGVSPDGDSLDLMTVFLILLLKFCGSTSYKMALVDCSNGRNPTKDESKTDAQQVDENESSIESPIPLKRKCLSAGTTHVVALRNCTVFSWGAGDSSLGLGPVARNVHLPQEVPSFSLGNICVASVACGRSHTIALTNHGVFTWGSSSRGQLGIPNCGQSPYPRRIPKLYSKEVVAVSAGQYHSIALTNSGTVLTWGWGVFGQLGHRSVEDLSEPTPVEALKGKIVVEASGGHAHTVVLLRDGTVMTFGSSAFGQLGYGKTAKSTSPVVVPNLPTDVCSVATGHFHCLALTSSNELYTWGLSPHVLKIQAQAKKKARAIQQLSQEPQQCQLPPRSQSFPNSPARATSASSSAPFSERQTYSLIDSDYRLPLQVESQQEEHREKALSNGADHRSVVQVPLQVPDVILDATLAAPPALSVEADSDAGVEEQSVGREELEENKKEVTTHDVTCGPDTVIGGVDCLSKPTVQVEPHLLPSLVDTSGVEGHIKEIACGCHHSALLTDAGHVYTWGRNPEGQLGVIGIRDSAVPMRVKVLPEKFAGSESVNDDAGKSTLNSQQGSRGQEWDGDDDTRFDSIDCGSECTFGVDSKGRIWGWGCNGHGQIGRLPSREPGRDLDGKTIKLPSSRRVIKIPMGLQDYSQLPVRVMGLPLCKEYKELCSHAPDWPYWFFGNDALRPCAVKLSPLKNFEEPAFGLRTLHHALRILYPCYNVALVREKCLEVKNLQASANIALQEKNYTLAVRHHLLALGEAADEEAEHSVTVADDVTDGDAAINDEEHPYENGCDDVMEGEGIHAFAVQGGNEEMSEGTGSSTSTSSGSRTSLENDDLSSPKNVAGRCSNNSWLANQALRIAEVFITLIEFKDRDALSGLLAECLQFWWGRGLPVELLEQFVKQHFDLLAYPLGNIMLLRKNGFTEDCSALFNSFSAKFHIDLCKTMTKRFSEEMSSEDRLKIVSAVIRQNPAWIDLRILAENPAPWDEDSPFIIQLGDGQCGDVTVFSCGHSVLPGDVPTLTVEAQKGLSKESAGILSQIVGNLSEGASQQNPLVKVEHACPTCIGRFLRLFDV